MFGPHYTSPVTPRVDMIAPCGLSEKRADLIKRLAVTRDNCTLTDIAVVLTGSHSEEDRLLTEAFFHLRALLGECKGHLEQTQAVEDA